MSPRTACATCRYWRWASGTEAAWLDMLGEVIYPGSRACQQRHLLTVGSFKPSAITQRAGRPVRRHRWRRNHDREHDLPVAGPGQSLSEAIARDLAATASGAAVDYVLHPVLLSPTPRRSLSCRALQPKAIPA